MKISVGLIQTGLTPNREEFVRRALDEVLSKGCQLIVLPEMWLTGFSASEESLKKAEAFINEVKEISRGTDTLIVAGTFPLKEGKEIYNAAVAIKNGSVVHTRKKLYLFEPMGETKIFSRGTQPEVFSYMRMRLGIAICYELRFPDIFLRLVEDEADIVIVPAQWPDARIEHWRTLLKARAIEGQFFVVGVNVVGSTKRLSFSGFSSVVHPLGHRILEVSHTEGLFITQIDLESAEDYRKSIPVRRDIKDALVS